MDLPSSTDTLERRTLEKSAPTASGPTTEPSLTDGTNGTDGARGESSRGGLDPKRMAEKASQGASRRGRSRTLKPAPAFAFEDSEDVLALQWPRPSVLEGEPFRKAR